MGLKPLVSMPVRAKHFDYTERESVAGHILGSGFYTLISALIIAVIIPHIVRLYAAHMGMRFIIPEYNLEPTRIFSAGAIIAAHISLRQMWVLPLVSTRSLIVPTFIMTYIVAILVMFVFKQPISLYSIFCSFIISISLYMALSIMRARYMRTVVGLFGFSRNQLKGLPGNINWCSVSVGNLPKRISALVVDPHAKFDVASAEFISELVLNGIPVYHRSYIEEGITGRVKFNDYADNNFGALLPSISYMWMRRFIDISLSIIISPIFIIIIIFAALIIKIDSPGPVFFAQQRRGYRGRLFTCYKLRTMRFDSSGPAFTTPADPRVTRCGQYLRKWRIDEMPQIVNVLRGDMAWIGPRPEAAVLAENYAEHVPFYNYRHAVRPGVTGWAAVHQGNVAEVDAASLKLEYDFYYIKYFSPWLDLLIVLKTLQTIWSGFGSL